MRKLRLREAKPLAQLVRLRGAVIGSPLFHMLEELGSLMEVTGRFYEKWASAPACVKVGSSQSSLQDLAAEVMIMGQRSENYCTGWGNCISKQQTRDSRAPALSLCHFSCRYKLECWAKGPCAPPPPLPTATREVRVQPRHSAAWAVAVFFSS